jgi:GT2 family glycosyltransferase
MRGGSSVCLSMNHAPTVSIVIPTCNRPDLLAKCLDRLQISMRHSNRTELEVIVSDDSADDRTRDLVASRYSWVKWIRGPRTGPSANRNSGVAVASGAWVFFTDDDCLPAEGWISAFSSAITTFPDFKVFEGRTVADRERQRMDEETPVNLEGGYLWSCNIAIERALFNHLGGFCEFLACLEDIDFRLRVTKAGNNFRFVREAEVCHPVRPCKGLAFQRKWSMHYPLLAERHPEVLGAHPWRGFVLKSARRFHALLREGVRFRFRGVTYAARALLILMWAECMAIRQHSTASRAILEGANSGEQ